MTAVVRQTFPLGPQWPTIDPFLFVAHHRDAYPAGNDSLGPDATLVGRQIGSDFADVDGWNMYHGSTVPGFPQHPHRGFETITYVRQGLIDHADSLGATARFGQGDTQWMTAGAGIQHCEMFPLLDRHDTNPLELFQIWLNLPAADKMVEPYFTMLWSHQTPTVVVTDSADRRTEITVVAGSLGEEQPATPPPDSWASKVEADVAIWHLKLDPGATWVLPAASGQESERVLYVFDGSTVTLGNAEGDTGNAQIEAGTGALIEPGIDIELTAGADGVECMLLQGRPLAEPIAQHGPFVMNTAAEIEQAFTDYQQTQFGGWPWSSPEPNHGPSQRRFALHADGRMENIGGPLTSADGKDPVERSQ